MIHSATFRRLQGKTQVLGITESDFHRTRLTHSMEVAQISRAIVFELQAEHEDDAAIRAALPEIPVIEAIAFCHDLGHPPFGHSGEIALNFMMRNHGGFEGNGHSLRLVSRLELHTQHFGLDLTRRVLLGILKYPARYSDVRRRVLPDVPLRRQLLREDWKPPKCHLDDESDIVKWIIEPMSPADRDMFLRIDPLPSAKHHGKTTHRALDTSVMELADDIAYGVHDFEDGVALGLITRDHWSGIVAATDSTWASQCGLDLASLEDDLFGVRTGLRSGRRKNAISAFINAFVGSVRIAARNECESPLLRFHAVLNESARRCLDAVTACTMNNVIRLQTVQTLEYRGRQIVMDLFEALESDWASLINPAFCVWIKETGEVQRGVCDYIAGMTDSYAIRVYERLFVPRQGTVFERL